jgi:hypothetical protein
LKPEIKELIDKTQAKSYLEVGLGNRVHFNAVPVEDKWGVSPDAKPDDARIFQAPSDIFFKSLCPPEKRFDVIFIDGLHRYEQVVRDLVHSLAVLAPGGFIAIHDIDPTNKNFKVYSENKNPGAWVGDTWKILPHVHFEMRKLPYYALQKWPGMLVVSNPDQFADFEITYPFADYSREALLGTLHYFNWK